MRALFVGPHCDDIELGCGGILSKYINQWSIYCCVLSAPNNSMPRDCLGIKQISIKNLQQFGKEDHIIGWSEFYLENHRQEIYDVLLQIEMAFEPDIVFVTADDDHQDHTTAYNETIRVFKQSSIYLYCPSLRNNIKFCPNQYFVLNDAHVEQKLSLLQQYNLYQNKIYFDTNNVMAVMRTWGLHIDESFAEGFIVYKNITR